MSPKPDTSKQKPVDAMSSTAMRRRREQQSAAERADAASSAAAADGQPAADVQPAAAAAAVASSEPAAPSPKPEELQMIGQELVPVSSVVKKESKGSETPARPKPSSMEGFQTPNQEFALVPVETKTPNSKLNGTEEEKVLLQEGSVEGTPNGPSGPPMSLGPVMNPAAPTSVVQSPCAPLFTPQQIRDMEDLQRRAPLLMQPQDRLSGMSAYQVHSQLGAPLGQLALPSPGIDPAGQDGHLLAAPRPQALGMDRAMQEWQEAQRQEMLWRSHTQHTLEQVALQLRASQSENQRLKDELRRVADGNQPSTFHTPEEKGKLGSGRKEDGTVVQQAGSSLTLDDQRVAILRAQEEMIANLQLNRFQEDGTRVRQDREDGTRVQQEREDGADARQEEKDSEDGAESQQGSSSESEDWQLPDRPAEGGGSRKRRKSGSKDQTLEVILKLMQGMQTLQQQIMKGRDDRKDEAEFVRHSVDLPKLQEWDAETAPIDFADWALCLGAHMGDLSNTSEAWWSKTMETAKAWYDRHMLLTPIERLTHSPQPTDDLRSSKWVRLERRASALLLACIPEALKEEVISAKQVSTLGIMCKAMIQYQPGGLAERAAILNALEQPTEAQSTGAAVAQLRKWIRWRRRAAELGVSMPDATILVRGISKLLRKVVASHPDLSFRLSLARNSLLIDTVPTQESVSQYSEHALNEISCQWGPQSEWGPQLLYHHHAKFLNVPS